MTDHELKRLVEREADEYRRQHADFPRLEFGSVHRPGTFIHLVVRPIGLTTYQSYYYDQLAQLERRLGEQHGLRVLLVPSLVDA